MYIKPSEDGVIFSSEFWTVNEPGAGGFYDVMPLIHSRLIY